MAQNRETNFYQDLMQRICGESYIAYNRLDSAMKIAEIKGVYLEPSRIIFSPPATIVFWNDGTKTVVKCMDGQAFDEYAGFTAAFTKKLVGDNSKIKRLIASAERVEAKRPATRVFNGPGELTI